jgi:hypothetical protein
MHSPFQDYSHAAGAGDFEQGLMQHGILEEGEGKGVRVVIRVRVRVGVVGMR